MTIELKELNEMEGIVSNKPRVVLIEDNIADLMLVEEALRESGVSCDLRTFSDGEKAIHFLRGLDPECPPIDLLLLDLHLPKLSGKEVLDCLSSSPRLAEIPILLMSSSMAPAESEFSQTSSARYFYKSSSLNEYMKLGGIIQGLLSDRKPTVRAAREGSDGNAQRENVA